MGDKALQLVLRGGGQQIFLRRLHEALVLGPFVGAENDRLREVERAEFWIDRHGHDGAGQGDILGFEARAFGAE